MVDGSFGDLFHADLFRSLEGRFDDLHQRVLPRLQSGTLAKAIARGLAEFSSGSDTLSVQTLNDIADAWGNRRWAAEVPFLETVVAAAMRTDGPILECGSGLSTVVLAMTSTITQNPIYSLEHEKHWLTKVEKALRTPADFTDLVHLVDAPLIKYTDSFEWYDISSISDQSSAQPFALVVCDGPPGKTLGGRYGLLPVMCDKLAAQAMILLDDANRPGEHYAIERWQQEFGVDVKIDRTGRGTALITMP